MKVDEIRKLTDEELLKVCNKRGLRKHNYTEEALMAQREWKRRKDVTLGFGYGGTNPRIWDGYGCDNR